MVVIPNFANLGGNKHNKTLSRTEKCDNTDSILMLLQEEASILKHLFFFFLYIYIHFCIRMTKAKLCSNRLCKSAFQKYLAKKNKKTKPKNNNKKTQKQTNKKKRASKWSQYITLLKKPKTTSGQHLLPPDSNLRLINNILRQHQWSQVEPLHLQYK